MARAAPAARHLHKSAGGGGRRRAPDATKMSKEPVDTSVVLPRVSSPLYVPVGWQRRGWQMANGAQQAADRGWQWRQREG